MAPEPESAFARTLQAAREERHVGRRLLSARLPPLGPGVLLAADRDVPGPVRAGRIRRRSPTSSARGSARRSSSPTASLIGGAVFVVGRFALVAVHELAHGLALAHYGRRAPRGGLRLVLIFPYAFVDTSEAYFESRTHRMVISAAGPACDLTLGALFSFACWVAPRGSISRRLLPAGVRRLRRRVLQPEPVPRPRRLQHPRRLPARAGPAPASPAAVRAAAVGVGREEEPRRCWPATRWRA